MYVKMHDVFSQQVKYRNWPFRMWQINNETSSDHLINFKRETLPFLKGSYNIYSLKRTLFCVFGVMQCVCGLRFKKHYFPHTVHYCCSSKLRLSETVNFYKAHCSEKRGVLWLASYPERCDWLNTSSVWRKCYTPYRIVMPCPSTAEAFVASSGDIITDYNDLYCLFTLHYV